MAIPAITRTWKQLLTAGVPGKRQIYSTLADQVSQLFFNIKDFLASSSGATTKYTLIWTSAGGVGPTTAADHTDRWTSAATVTPQATIAAASQAWAVLQAANGAQILLANQGATADRARISFSPGGLFTLAGTTTNQPTATDEQLMMSGATVTVVGTGTASDRICHIWASDDGNSFRVVLYSASANPASAFGVEEFASSAVSPAVITPAVWGFFYNDAALSGGQMFNTYIAGTRGGVVRPVVAGSPINCTIFAGMEGHGGAGTFTMLNAIYTYQPELQGSGYTPYPISIHSSTVGARGRVGNLVDWLALAPTSSADGDGFGTSYQWMQVGTGIMWPNPSNVAPTIL